MVNYFPEKERESSGGHASENLVRCGFELGSLYKSTERLDRPTTYACLTTVKYHTNGIKNQKLLNSTSFKYM